MARKSSRRSPQAASVPRNRFATRRESSKPTQERFSYRWSDLRDDRPTNLTDCRDLIRLIERDAPLQNHSILVLMYGPFQAEMQPNREQGVASWLRECIGKHGLPSLVRFDNRRHAQVFRRDQFQPWLEPFL
jgi:hypothetical protein